MKKIRADELLFSLGLASTRSLAKALIMEGKVRLGDKTVLKPGEMLPCDSPLMLLAPPKFVGRGGVKLEHALHKFEIDVTGLVIIDIGASTGGFTDCMLLHRAKKVYAVDVGVAQLAPKLVSDPRVVIMDKTNARYLERGMFDEAPQLATVDVSFISGDKVIAPLRGILAPPGLIIWLLKPQFEAGPHKVGKGGVIRKDDVLKEAIMDGLTRALQAQCEILDMTASPIKGADGNREFLVLLSFQEKGGLSIEEVFSRMMQQDQSGGQQN